MATVEDEPLSRWWYGVAFFVAVLSVYWAYLAASRLAAPAVLGGVVPRPGPLPPLVAAAGMVFSTLLAPAYAVCLYLDVRKLRRSDAGWLPNPAVWGVVGLLHLGSLLLPPVSAIQLLTVPAGAWYLYRRRERVGLELG